MDFADTDSTETYRFTASLTDEELAGVAGFDTSSRLVQPLTTDHAQVNASIDQLNAGGQTNTAAGLQGGVDELVASGSTARNNELILLADGGTNQGDDPVAVAETAAAEGIEINTVGLGSNVNEAELREIADTTGGSFFHAESADDLPETFERVRSPPDSDDDGLPDQLEREGITLGIGGGVANELGADGTVSTDPFDPDTDSDGLREGSEVGEYTEIDLSKIEIPGADRGSGPDATLSYYKMVSDPTETDTDGDGLTDYEEVETLDDLNPTNSDVDGDGITDSEDPEPTTPRPEAGHVWAMEFAETNDQVAEFNKQAVYGALFGEVGVEYTGQVAGFLDSPMPPNADFDEADTESMAYVAGWVLSGFMPVVGAVGDTRDCLVFTGDTKDDAVDCAFAGVSIIFSAGTIAGAVSAPLTGGSGALLAGGSVAADSVQSAAKGAKIVAKAIKRDLVEPDQIVRWVYRKFPISNLDVDFAGKVTENLDDRRDIDRVEEAADKQQAQKVLVTDGGFPDDLAAALRPVYRHTDVPVDQLKGIQDNLDAFEEVGGVQNQRALAEQLVKQTDEPVEAANRLNELETDEVTALSESVKVGHTNRLLTQTDLDAVRDASQTLDTNALAKLADADDPAHQWQEFRRLSDQVTRRRMSPGCSPSWRANSRVSPINSHAKENSPTVNRSGSRTSTASRRRRTSALSAPNGQVGRRR